MNMMNGKEALMYLIENPTKQILCVEDNRDGGCAKGYSVRITTDGSMIWNDGDNANIKMFADENMKWVVKLTTDDIQELRNELEQYNCKITQLEYEKLALQNKAGEIKEILNLYRR